MSLYNLLYKLSNELDIIIGGSAALKIYHNNYSHIRNINLHYELENPIDPSTIITLYKRIVEIFRIEGIKLSVVKSCTNKTYPEVFLKAVEVPEDSYIFRNTTEEYHVSLTHVHRMIQPDSLIYRGGRFYHRRVIVEEVI